MWLYHEHDSQLGLERDVPPQGSQQAQTARELAQALESLHQHARFSIAASQSQPQPEQLAMPHEQANKPGFRVRGSSTGMRCRGVEAQGAWRGKGWVPDLLQRWVGRLLPAGGSLQWGAGLGQGLWRDRRQAGGWEHLTETQIGRVGQPSLLCLGTGRWGWGLEPAPKPGGLAVVRLSLGRGQRLWAPAMHLAGQCLGQALLLAQGSWALGLARAPRLPSLREGLSAWDQGLGGFAGVDVGLAWSGANEQHRCQGAGQGHEQWAGLQHVMDMSKQA